MDCDFNLCSPKYLETSFNFSTSEDTTTKVASRFFQTPPFSPSAFLNTVNLPSVSFERSEAVNVFIKEGDLEKDSKKYGQMLVDMERVKKQLQQTKEELYELRKENMTLRKENYLMKLSEKKKDEKIALLEKDAKDNEIRVLTNNVNLLTRQIKDLKGSYKSLHSDRDQDLKVIYKLKQKVAEKESFIKALKYKLGLSTDPLNVDQNVVYATVLESTAQTNLPLDRESSSNSHK